VQKRIWASGAKWCASMGLVVSNAVTQKGFPDPLSFVSRQERDLSSFPPIPRLPAGARARDCRYGPAVPSRSLRTEERWPAYSGKVPAPNREPTGGTAGQNRGAGRRKSRLRCPLFLRASPDSAVRSSSAAQAPLRRSAPRATPSRSSSCRVRPRLTGCPAACRRRAASLLLAVAAPTRRT
jgi:hypothetical protein